MRDLPLRTLSRISLFAALIAAGSFVAIPLPFSPVPIVLANLFVVLSGIVLGAKAGTAAVLLYLIMGAVGVPVFAGGVGGIVHFASPTGGYLIGYLAAAFVAGAISAPARRNSNTKDRSFSSECMFGFLASLCGLAIIYVPGVAWMAFLLDLSVSAALATGVIPFVIGDLLKASVAAAAVPALSKSGSLSQDGANGAARADS